ncbi:hypothetical protein NCS57_00440700 [Fusarium keratoplasticum]|uniref:Uncharacterized protein n=1 Tax=Fusarium keratoplasticum TaxID=1328300 RepID=A0ACC0R500_9HYPO|nr:hypothetical protein NCS57_00440700 [Fusarium keratoplasticum]KAI8675396.1 hypothetical protein NCS57_00440700 [Fusarium keratoplasticum]KAI8681840.1 hypothetical protein NCS55_00437300 [Fusarium keratoplasticum]
MENSFSFSPLWREISIAKRVDPALKPLHGIILQRALRDIPLPELENKKLQTEDILESVASLIPDLLSDLAEDNDILKNIRTLAAREIPGEKPSVIIQASISMWYAEAISSFREHYQPGKNDTMELAGLPRGMPWEHSQSEQFPFANLGFIAMLVVGEVWEKPADLKFRSACLVAHTALAFLYITHVLGEHLADYPWRSLSTYVDEQSATALLLKISLSIVAKGYRLSQPSQAPAIEFNVAPNTIRVSGQGRKLLVKVAMDNEWRSVPFWHPYRRVPGSPWNNYIINTQLPTFPASTPPPQDSVEYHLPCSAFTLTDGFENAYEFKRVEMDVDVPGTERSLADREERFIDLARLSEGTYPGMRLDGLPPNEINDISDEYLYFTPAGRTPRSDMGGYLTLNFLNAACHACQFLEDADADDDDFYLMTFTHYIDNGQGA